MQVRFGARSGAAPVFLGLLKVVLGLLFGSSLYQLLKAFPQPILGSLMIFSGAHPQFLFLHNHFFQQQDGRHIRSHPRFLRR